MFASISQEPDPSEFVIVIVVGPDGAGRWVVQDADRRIEGRFVSQAAALNFARAEREIHRGTIRISEGPLSPSISFSPVGEAGSVLAHAA